MGIRLLKKITSYVFIAILMVCMVIIPVSAETDVYSRVDIQGGGTENRLSREMYTATQEITASTFGLDNFFEGITDIFSGDSGDIYLLCGDTSRLYHISNDYSQCSEIFVTDSQGNPENYKGARGIYYDNENNIYIADTYNSRILVTNPNGNVLRILEAPVSELIPDDFLFQPASIEIDREGYIYVLSLGCYYGVLLYTPDYEFMGFYGSNTVQSTALDMLTYLWEKLTSNDTKKASSAKTLPYSFTDFSFDSDGYMVTVTGAITSNVWGTQTSGGQIKKISNNGANILYKRTISGSSESSTSVNFLESQASQSGGVQDLVSIAVSEDDYIFALDGGHGMIYIYDSECNLMSAFGGGHDVGEKLGVFKNPVSITLNHNDILVADSGKNSITVFKTTEYGNLIRSAQTSYIKGDYDSAEELWEEVLSLNRNCQLAYRGLAMAYYNDGDYKAALQAAKIAVDYSVYDMAWQEIISDFIADNFVIIVIVLLLILAGILLLVKYMRKRNKKFIKNKKIINFLKTPFHPFNCFDDLKYKNMGSLKIAITITVLFYVASVLNVIASGFLYSNTLLRNYNALYTLGGTVGLILLWSVCNWLVSSMFEGKGNFKEVYIATSYAVAPWVLFLFIKVILSHFVPLSASGIITGFSTVLLIYTFFLLCIAMMKVHEFDFFKFLLTSIVVIFFMILVLFVLFMCAILMAQFVDFIASIYDEVAHR